MGAAARGVKAEGGYIHGVVPSFFKETGVEMLFDKCDKLTYTPTMRERKAIMEDDADAFIVVPGGVGTLEELYEIITLKQLNRHDKAIVIYNIDGYYDDLGNFMKGAVDRKFISKHCLKLYEIMDDADKILDYLENYEPVSIPFSQTKLGE
jgi:hypothetical protein